ncbi:epoxide hydrolase family protein [Microbacterium gorillae]|uniref:epoxide hydrolase family protein n=1 Tax=Microbacterium gorillae TaxID=1231063 RepID=UPI0006947C61|nr:epoxide hydrolase [Microbacterium gorillae]
MSETTPAVHPFSVAVDPAELDELQQRLAAARLPERETVPPGAAGRDRWAQGVPLADLTDLIAYWRSDYDWFRFEAELNRIGSVRTTIEGLGIHALHRRSSRADAVPLVMTHGWPGSVVEFVDVIEELTEPSSADEPAFHVVAPALPGFGFSDRPDESGWGIERIASAWVELMRRLGYDRFLAHGGDWGGTVTTVLAGRFPEHVIGIHSTFAQGPPGLSLAGLTPQDRAWAEGTTQFWQHRAAYAKQQAARPQTIGYALVDSPVGLLAWLLDKFADWSDTDDSPFQRISRDRLLDDVTLYWLTRTGASAARIYAESHAALDPDLRVDVPAAITMYPGDPEKCPRPWAEQRYRWIVRWSTPPAGGHFPALEVTHDFIADLRAGLAAVRAVS